MQISITAKLRAKPAAVKILVFMFWLSVGLLR
jgi:hypothetical protein